MIQHVTFASPEYSKSAELCMESAKRMGVDNSLLIVPAKPSTERGYGFWKWKPRTILAAMEGGDFYGPLADGDILIYSDAGLEFTEPVQTVIDFMDQDIWLFGNEHLHAHWCKADIPATILGMQVVSGEGEQNWLWQDHPLHDADCACRETTVIFGKQVQASVIFFRVNEYTRAFVKEWLHWCLFEGGRLIDDSPSRTPNHPEFKENRHDQAILTTMAYRDGIKLHEWFVKYEGYTPGRMNGYPRELERPFVFHHRRKNHEWEGRAA